LSDFIITSPSLREQPFTTEQDTAYLRCFFIGWSPKVFNMPSIEAKFSKRLRELREDRKLTQEELAARSGLDYKHIQRLEGSDPSSPTLATIEKLANALDLQPWQLLKFER
jgi:DNA-binding Xre family transcriptional regulator